MGAKKRRLGEILIDARMVSEQQLSAALAEQRKWGGKLGRTLVEMGILSEESMVRALSHHLQLPAIDLDTAPLPDEVFRLLRVDMAERYGVFPVGGDAKNLQVATSDPTNYEALQELSQLINARLSTALATASSIDRAVRRYYYGEAVQGTAAVTPQQLGVRAKPFDPSLLQVSRSPVMQANGRPEAPPAGGDLVRQVAQLEDRLAMAERLLANQTRAMRGMLELLVERGLLTREEYLARLRSGQP